MLRRRGYVARWLCSVTRRYCIIRAKPILKPFRPSGSPIIIVSSDRAPIPNSKGNRFGVGVKYTGLGKLGDYRAVFDGSRRLSREIGRWLLWNVSRGYRIEWYHFRWPWVAPNPGFKITTYKSNISKTVRFRDKVTKEHVANHTRSTEWYHFQWPWVTSDPNCKVTTFLDIEYLRNDTR